MAAGGAARLPDERRLPDAGDNIGLAFPLYGYRDLVENFTGVEFAEAVIEHLRKPLEGESPGAANVVPFEVWADSAAFTLSHRLLSSVRSARPGGARRRIHGCSIYRRLGDWGLTRSYPEEPRVEDG